MRNCGLAVALGFVAALILGAAPVLATSKMIQGTIKSVKDDGSSFVCTGYDFYNAKTYDSKICDPEVKPTKDCVYTLDGMLVTWQVALKPGRKFYSFGSSAGVRYVNVLSEAADATVGTVKGVDEANDVATLTVKMGADAKDVAVPLRPKTLFRQGGRDATKADVLRTGQWVRVLAGRKGLVEVISEETQKKVIPEGVPNVVPGVVKTAAAGNLTLEVLKDGRAAELPVEALKGVVPVFDARLHCTLAEVLVVGQPVVYLRVAKRPGKFDDFLLAMSADEGRVQGTLKAADAEKRTVSVSVLQAGGLADVNATFAADATVRLDGKEAQASEALKPGRMATVFAPRAQIIEAIAAPPEKAGGH